MHAAKLSTFCFGQMRVVKRHAGAAEETLVEDAFDSGGWGGRRGAYGIGVAAAVGAGALGGVPSQ